jgi:hypothetical protein
VPEQPEPRLAAAEAVEARNRLSVGGGGGGGGGGAGAPSSNLGSQVLSLSPEKKGWCGGLRGMAGRAAADRRRRRLEKGGAARRREARQPRVAVAGGWAGAGGRFRHGRVTGGRGGGSRRWRFFILCFRPDREHTRGLSELQPCPRVREILAMKLFELACRHVASEDRTRSLSS